MLSDYIDTFYTGLSALLLIAFSLLIITVIILFIIDITQTRYAVRRNYPVIGRFRGLFEHLGTFFRQYFFAMDREEMPFNRALREWVYRAAKNEDNTIPFGSTRDLSPAGSISFVNCPYPTLDVDAAETEPMVIGTGCRTPYTATSFFNISGMSYGAISKVAVQALSNGAAKAGCWMNTGEGGLSPYHLEGGCDIVMQIGTAKYGVRDEKGELSDDRLRELAAIEQVRMFEIKLSQGAKPGKGGILPAAKVTAEIATIRGIPQGEDSISPNRHVDIDNPGQLLDMIARVREVTGKPVGIKLVIGGCNVLDNLFDAIKERGVESAPDFITLDSSDGGTGAAPQPLMDFMGLPLKESLPMLIDHLVGYGLRDRVRVICSGKLITPSGIAWALCMGADFIVSARGFMFALGCIQAMQCNKNSCPTGITTHQKRLQRGLDPTDKAVRVHHYANHIQHDVGVIAHSCGVKHPRQLQRRHARVVTGEGSSTGLHIRHPETIEGYPHGKPQEQT
ncbi:FMN-binding glutamate synthase family protein [Mariprofundus sp. NF]|uniref:FMN-binding glutamate synthase family protein n=1 Tax=Mariprofundus sp. NF TaxID=2608716 RepID=UPI0015A2ED9D|nr:FMN-binding glutamate synthase family protein [Mariprofundus sp. NF]NWF39199.1 FMN-binding glutamate synthase family protein [Mariprofundus sp. NF]